MPRSLQRWWSYQRSYHDRHKHCARRGSRDMINISLGVCPGPAKKSVASCRHFRKGYFRSVGVYLTTCISSSCGTETDGVQLILWLGCTNKRLPSVKRDAANESLWLRRKMADNELSSSDDLNTFLNSKGHIPFCPEVLTNIYMNRLSCCSTRSSLASLWKLLSNSVVDSTEIMKAINASFAKCLYSHDFFSYQTETISALSSSVFL